MWGTVAVIWVRLSMQTAASAESKPEKQNQRAVTSLNAVCPGFCLTAHLTHTFPEMLHIKSWTLSQDKTDVTRSNFSLNSILNKFVVTAFCLYRAASPENLCLWDPKIYNPDMTWSPPEKPKDILDGSSKATAFAQQHFLCCKTEVSWNENPLMQMQTKYWTVFRKWCRLATFKSLLLEKS